MRNRLTKTPDNTLVTAIRQLQSGLAGLKQAQRTSGQSGVLGFTTQSGATWDLTGTVGTDSDTAYNTTTISVVFTGDGSQDIVFANLSFDVFVNGTDSAHQLTPQVSSWTDGTRVADIVYNGVTISHHTYTAQFTLNTFMAITYYVKGFAVGSSPGSITASV